MNSSGQNLVSEVLGLAVLSCVSWWRRLPQFHFENDSTSGTFWTRFLSRSTLYRISAASSLVLFQISLTAADVNTRWVIPLVSIAVFFLLRFMRQLDPESSASYSLLNPSSWSAKLDIKEPSTLPLISIAASLLLLWSDYSSIDSATAWILPLLAGAGFFVFLSLSVTESDNVAEKTITGTSQNESRRFVRILAASALVISTVMLVLLGAHNVSAVDVVLGMFLKGSQAFGLIYFAAENALTASSTVTMAAVAASILEEPFVFPDIRSLLAFCGSVVQILFTAPKANDKRIFLFAFLFVPGLILPIQNQISLVPTGLSEATVDLQAFPEALLNQTHPVARMHQRWGDHFQQKLASQSKTLTDAVNEYKRRYNRNPPPGFDKWFQFAQANKYVMIDEFDSLMAQMDPFWQVSPEDLLSRLRQTNSKGQNFVELEIINSNVTRMSMDHWYTDAIVQWFEKFRPLEILPNFNMTMNAFDEPRAVSYPAYRGPSFVTGKGPRVDKNNVTWVDNPKKSVYPQIAPACPNGGYPELNDESAYTFSSHGIDFVNGGSARQDVCLSRSLRTEHGFFSAPDNMRLTHHVVPFFSQAAPERFSDILLPTPFYYTAVDVDIEATHLDISWENKANQIYWAGSSTGGHHTLENWRHIHRNRISLMTNAKSIEPVTLLRRESGKWVSYQSWWNSIAKYFNVKVTRMVQCEKAACHEMEQAFNLTMEKSGSTLGYKYNLDIDGNSYTGRFYRLLRSNSCVIKSTIFREWHDDILVPWVHYIPLSNGAQEFGEMMRFLIEDQEGDYIGKRIGIGGRSWTTKALRKVDMEIYALRVFMEYTRLFDEQRDTHGFFLDKTSK